MATAVGIDPGARTTPSVVAFTADRERLVDDAVIHARTGIKDPARPLGSFIFIGPSGVGKTELARALAQALFDSEENMVSLDMSEYHERQLTEQVRRKPYSVVLFDHIEKAHPDVFDTLLQLLDEGWLVDAQGRTVDFRNTVVVMSSNIGSSHLLEGIDNRGQVRDGVRDRVMGEVRAHFRPELLTRVDDIVLFKPLTLEEREEIVDLQVADLRKRLADCRLELGFTDDARALIARKAYDPVNGARRLQRFIRHEVEPRIGRALLAGDIPDGTPVTLDADGDELTVRWEDAAVRYEPEELAAAA